jgi:hypothetical protein
VAAIAAAPVAAAPVAQKPVEPAPVAPASPAAPVAGSDSGSEDDLDALLNDL